MRLKLKNLIKIKKLGHFIFIAYLTTYLMVTSFAADNCTAIVKNLLVGMDSTIAKSIDLDKHVNHRVFIANYAKKNGIAVFYKQNQSGEDIPFILVNRESSKKLTNFIDNSYGTDVVLQPNHGNDHGLMRTGNFIIDVDAPGYRGYNELHKTGLAWKDFSSYISRRQQNSGIILEVSYLVTPEEKRVIDFYQRIRRAAIFRVKFSFKDFKTEDHPFLLNNGGEHCFIFCKAQAVTSHNNELRAKLNTLGLKDIDAFFMDPEVIKRIDEIKNIVLSTDPARLGPELLNDEKILKSFNQFYPPEIQTAEQKFEFLRWAISYEGSGNYNRVLKDLGVSSDYGINDIKNKRVSAILVYDENVTPENFNNAKYTAKGAFTPWPLGLQKPVE